MDYRVVLAPQAIEDLRGIVVYVAVDRPEAADRLVRALIAKAKSLAEFPLQGRVVPEFGVPAVRELILAPFRIVYRIDEKANSVGIARFWHGARGYLTEGDIGV
jgi:plasmid stabilization system protein ParE